MEEYLTIAETAALLKVGAKRVRNLMCCDVFKQGEHFFGPPALARGSNDRRSWLG